MEQRLQQMQAEVSLSRATEGMHSQNSVPSIVEICVLLSERHLQRLLQKTGTSFQDLQNQSRKKTARMLMRNRCLGLDDIASKLGFDDRGRFSRAFTKCQYIPSAKNRTKHLGREALSSLATLCRLRLYPRVSVAS